MLPPETETISLTFWSKPASRRKRTTPRWKRVARKPPPERDRPRRMASLPEERLADAVDGEFDGVLVHASANAAKAGPSRASPMRLQEFIDGTDLAVPSRQVTMTLPG